ncbi:MAG: DUF72 domain-containing protein [Bryobacterales bacterium]|nr:DUF72 domain-containing protein [Bryobacterales bacterium]
MPASPLCAPSGWAHPNWNGLVYPQLRPPGFHRLAYLARHFDLVEIDASRHAPLRPEISRLWLRKAGPATTFTALLSRRFTEERDLDPAAVREFKDGLWPLLRAGRLGCLLMEFPRAFRFTRENRDFLIALRRTFHEFPLAAEMRHGSWMLDEALGALMDYRIGFCNLDQAPWTRAMPPAAIVTSGIGYVRLHGRGPGYLYSPAELEEWRVRIERVAAHTNACYVVTTNTDRGKSVVNALELQALLGRWNGLAPGELARHYPDRFAALAPVSRQTSERWRLCG